MRFALLSTVPTVTLDLLGQLAAAATPVLADVAASWSTADPTITPPEVRVVEKVSDLTDEDVPVVFVPAFPPEDAMDLAYHDIQADSKGIPRPYALVLAEPGMNADVITQSAFHEMAEALVDPGCATYDKKKAREVCDPVQGRRITRSGVVMSGYVTSRWAGYAYAGPCAVSDDGADIEPGERDPDGYVMYEDGHQDPPGYDPPNRDPVHGRRTRRRALLARRS